MSTCEVRLTRVAQGQINGLRSTVRKVADRFLDDLAAAGCSAMGYRLSGSDTLERLCVKHLRGAWRAVVAFPETNLAVVLLVGEHLTDPGRNLYDLLYLIVGHSPAFNSGRTKPPCCTDETGLPPHLSMDAVDAVADRVQEVLGRQRR